MKKTTNKAQNKSGQSSWIPTDTTNLIQYAPSGVYFARYAVSGKQFRYSLKTKVKGTAKLRLADILKDAIARSELQRPTDLDGKCNMAKAFEIFETRIQDRPDLKPKSKTYRLDTVGFIKSSWPELWGMRASTVTESHCEEWLRGFSKKYAPSVVNNTIGTLRSVFDLVIELGVRAANPSARLKKVKILQKELQLPSKEEFNRFVEEIRHGGSRHSKNCAEFVQFLAFTGMRISEACNIIWSDVDFKNSKIRIAGDDQHRTKNSEIRHIPIFPELKVLLDSIREERGNPQPQEKVLNVQEAQKSMTHAAEKIGMKRITHHDLRHLFATMCIESDVEITVVSRWLGHKDGGVLAMKTYGHLRDERTFFVPIESNAKP